MAAAAAEKEAIDDMKREKSCGALVVRKNGENFDLVLLRHRFGGHWSFPKGHVEAGESERQTALREVREETGLAIRLLDGFRESVEYFPKPGVKKQVVYFLGEALGELTAFFRELGEQSGLSRDMLAPLFKITGIALVVKAGSGLCRDAGESALAGAVETAGSVCGLLAALPLLRAVLKLLLGLI